ncbi:MAG: hypothetical protein ABJG68_17455 [Crocinitomicaceae bacterium]
MGKKILLISTEAWGPNFVSKHHYANYLSENHEVYFLNPASGFNKNPFGDIQLKHKKLKDGLYSLTYKNLVPKLNNLPKAVQKSIYKKQANQIHKGLDINEFDIVWSFDPYRYWDLSVFNAKKHLYHTVDFHPTAKFESDCANSADHVICVTELIKSSLTTKNTSIHKIGHGADINGFEQESVTEIPGKNKLKACYVGNFHNHIDYEMLLQLTKENQHCDFIMIGPTLDSNLSSGNKISMSHLKALEQQQNLFFIGSVVPQLLMSYLNKMDINLVLFKKENQRIHCSPHKLMGYFYSGKTTLSNYIDEHKNTSSEIITMVDDQHEIPLRFKQIISEISLHNSKELQEKRRNFAVVNSYTNKIEQIFALIQDESN